MMLTLMTQPNLKVSRPGGMNLRPCESAPNFALARNVVSEGFLANLKYLLTERGAKIPRDAKASPFLLEYFRATFIDNLKECFRRTPKAAGDTVYSLRGIASPGIKIESQPLYLSVFLSIRDIIVPPKLPPLDLTSGPVEVPEIWSRRRKLSGANMASVMLHVSFAVLALAFTFRHVTHSDPVKSVTILVAPPAPAAAAPPPARVPAPTVAHRGAYTKRKSFFVQGKLTAPVAIRNVVSAKRSTDDVSAPDLSLGGVPGGSSGGILGGVLGGESAGIPGGVPGGNSVAPSPSEAASPKPGLVRVGGSVKRPKTIYAPAPEFPPLARHAKIAGVVTVEAVIDEYGNVVKLKPVGGNALLIGAALKAVAQWKFEPTYLNGVPVAVEMEVEVTFHLVSR